MSLRCSIVYLSKYDLHIYKDYDSDGSMKFSLGGFEVDLSTEDLIKMRDEINSWLNRNEMEREEEWPVI